MIPLIYHSYHSAAPEDIIRFCATTELHVLLISDSGVHFKKNVRIPFLFFKVKHTSKNVVSAKTVFI